MDIEELGIIRNFVIIQVLAFNVPDLDGIAIGRDDFDFTVVSNIDFHQIKGLVKVLFIDQLPVVSVLFDLVGLNFTNDMVLVKLKEGHES